MTWGEVASIGFGLLGSIGGALWWAARWAINRLCGRLNAIAESIAERSASQADKRNQFLVTPHRNHGDPTRRKESLFQERAGFEILEHVAVERPADLRAHGVPGVAARPAHTIAPLRAVVVQGGGGDGRHRDLLWLRYSVRKRRAYGSLRRVPFSSLVNRTAAVYALHQGSSVTR